MLLYSAKIPVKDTMTEQQFIDLCAEWLLGSPHYHEMKLEYDLTEHQDYTQNQENITVHISCYKDESISIVGFRLEKKDKQVRWYADYLFHDENGKKFVMIQNHRDSVSFIPALKFQKKPHIVKQLIQNGYASDKGAFPVGEFSYPCTNDALEICASYMNGECTDDLPLVYVSRNNEKKLLVDANHLAFELAGKAYVVTEPDISTSFQLKEKTGGKNAYHGAIGVYYPNSTRYEIFRPKYRIWNELENEVVESISQKLISHMDATRYSWAQLQMRKARAKVLKFNLSARENDELREFIEMAVKNESELSNENKELREKIYELQCEIESKDHQLQEARKPRQNAEKLLTLHTSQADLYYEEQHDLLLRHIQAWVKEKHDNAEITATRRYEILKDIAEHNHEIGDAVKLKAELKKILKDGFKWSRDRTKLESLGFEPISQNEHSKTSFKGTKYHFNFPKTPSEYRGLKNLCGEIIRSLGLD